MKVIPVLPWDVVPNSLCFLAKAYPSSVLGKLNDGRPVKLNVSKLSTIVAVLPKFFSCVSPAILVLFFPSVPEIMSES
jgi:hypothetical protein